MTESRRKSRGFSLVEIAIVLAILGFVLTIGLKSTGAYLSVEKRQTTVARLAGIDAALVNFVALQKRLPCPAVGSSAAGVEVRAANGTCTLAVLNNGVVPWVTLGISEAEAQDGWGNRISYRTSNAVGAALTIDNKMDMSLCNPAADIEPVPPAANRPTLTCTTTTPPLHYLWGLGRGLEVRNGAGDKLMDPYLASLPALPAAQVPASPTGAAYVLISHGENRAGAYSSSGTIQIGLPPVLPATLTLEDRNKNRNADPTYPGFFVDAPQNDSGGAAQFDDIVLRPTIMSVVTRAGLGPRAH